MRKRLIPLNIKVVVKWLKFVGKQLVMFWTLFLDISLFLLPFSLGNDQEAIKENQKPSKKQLIIKIRLDCMQHSKLIVLQAAWKPEKDGGRKTKRSTAAESRVRLSPSFFGNGYPPPPHPQCKLSYCVCTAPVCNRVHRSTSVRTVTVPNICSRTVVWTHENATHISKHWPRKQHSSDKKQVTDLALRLIFHRFSFV